MEKTSPYITGKKCLELVDKDTTLSGKDCFELLDKITSTDVKSIIKKIVSEYLIELKTNNSEDIDFIISMNYVENELLQSGLLTSGYYLAVGLLDKKDPFNYKDIRFFFLIIEHEKVTKITRVKIINEDCLH